MAGNYESFYYGSVSPLDPKYGELFSGYRVPAGRIGASTSIQTADQIREVSARLSEGMKIVEVGTTQPEIFETIPKQHMKEIHRLSKLTGTETTVHAPIIEPSGLTEHGWNEAFRDAAERRLLSVVERAHELNPQGNTPVTIHASAIPGADYMKTIEGAAKVYDVAIDQETGQMIPLKREFAFYPETPAAKMKGGEVRTPEEQLGMINRGDWSSKISNMAITKKHGDEILTRLAPNLIDLQQKMKEGTLTAEEMKRSMPEINRADMFFNSVQASFRPLFNTAYKFVGTNSEETELGRRVLKSIADDWQKFHEEAEKGKINQFNMPFAKSKLLDETFQKLGQLREYPDPKNPERIINLTPQIYSNIEDFAINKSAQTFGDIAFKAYEKYKNTAPMICLENPPVGSAFARAEDMRELIKKSRENFEELAKEGGYSASEARAAAEKMIGATWDVGHINMLRKGGFTKEDIVRESEKIAPYVKHIHLTDNFGYADTHLPVGMGEVPVKEILKEMEKAGFAGKEIMEAGGFVAQFKTSPHPFVLEALGSPIYSAYMQPFWNQARASYGGYFSGYGTMLPDQHFSMYGAGFSGMPAELGGQIPGKQSRLSGTPIE